MAQSATTNFGWQNKFSTTLTSGITSTDTTIPLNALPTPSEGFLVIEPDSSTNWEVIYYTSKTGSAVVCTSVANGRGVDDSTAISHSQGATVRMDTTAGMFEILQNMTAVTAGSAGGIAFASGWTPYASTTPNTVTALGNRSYSCVFNSVDLTSVLSPGMRLKLTRTVTAPTQCTSLNGTTQYYSKATPAGMTFTDTFTCAAWIKLASYNGAQNTIIRRGDATSGWVFDVESTGQLLILGFNAAAFRGLTTYQSVPLNKWVHVAMTMTMSTGTATAYIDGVAVPTGNFAGSTAITSLTNSGNLGVGATSAGLLPFNGKIAQAAVYSAVLSSATILAAATQTLTGTETSLISAYSFNGIITDLNANANNLTANGSAVATTLDTPFTQTMTGVTTGTTNYGIITAASFSTNTTLTVQVAEGDTIPTSGGVSAISYSTQKVPYGFPSDADKFSIYVLKRTDTNQTPVNNTVYNLGGISTTMPIGIWDTDWTAYIMGRAAAVATMQCGLGTTNSSLTGLDLYSTTELSPTNAIVTYAQTFTGKNVFTITSATTYYLNTLLSGTTVNNLDNFGARQASKIIHKLTYF